MERSEWDRVVREGFLEEKGLELDIKYGQNFNKEGLKIYCRYRSGNEHGLSMYQVGDSKEIIVGGILVLCWDLYCVQKMKIEKEDETRKWRTLKSQVDAFGLGLQIRAALLNLENDEI